MTESVKKPEMLTACRWFDAVNPGVNDIEPYAPCEVMGVQVSAEGHVLFRVQKPSKPSPEVWCVNGRLRIAGLGVGSGQVTFDSPHVGQFQPDDITSPNKTPYGVSSATATFARTELGFQDFGGYREYFAGGGWASLGTADSLLGIMTEVSPVLTKATYDVSAQGALSSWTTVSIDAVTALADSFDFISHSPGGSTWTLQSESLCGSFGVTFGDSSQDGKVQARWQHFSPGAGWTTGVTADDGVDHAGTDIQIPLSATASFFTAGTQIRLQVNSTSNANGCAGTVTFWR